MSPEHSGLLAYLGPPGSFAHAAVNLLSTPWTGEVSPRTSVADVIFSVESGEAEVGIVPLEASVEGDVSSTVDELIFRSSMCFINEEIIVPINYVVAGKPGAQLEGTERIVTTTAAMAQCRRFLEGFGAEVTLVESVGVACEVVAGLERGEAVALTTADAAKINGLAVLRGVAEDHSGISTRMARLGRRVDGPTGSDRTSIVVTPVGDRTGVLAEILECFRARDIALTSISSRAVRTKMGEYSFLLTALGHLADERLQGALAAVAELPADIKLLGSYPVRPGADAARVAEAPPPGSVDASNLGSWISTLLGSRLGSIPSPASD